ncbi:acyltransferase [Undibacterium sp.]|uniref:acyltransferase family protein n=1 Tax=Undibacterium sp. TaxID=1914977 RepID=UPI003752C8FE
MQTSRTDFLDRIRVLLTALVILHHTAIMYGAEGGWYLRYQASGETSGLLLTLFCAVNQAFFMGMFFLLAGYFSTRSFDTKGTRQFLLDRLLRLGVPILVFGFVLGPLSNALAETAAGESVWSFWWHLMARASFNIGPLWFAYALLIFSVALMALRLLLPRLRWNLSTAVLSHTWVVFFLMAWGLGAFALRLWVPTGQERGLLQIGYFASYILLFFFGCAAAHSRLLENIDKKLALPWGWISLLTIPSLFAYAILSGALKGVEFHVNGGWTLPALAYAMWEPFVACGVMLMLLWRFRVSAKPWAFWKKLTPLCFAAFIVHAPVVVGLGVLLQAWKEYSLAMFVAVGAASLLASFGVAALLVKLPGAKKIL